MQPTSLFVGIDVSKERLARILQLNSYLSLCHSNCIAVGTLREQTGEMCEEGRLPRCRPRESEHRLSPIRPEDRPARKEGSPQRRQGPDRTLSEAPLQLPDQVV